MIFALILVACLSNFNNGLFFDPCVYVANFDMSILLLLFTLHTNTKQCTCTCTVHV